MKLFISYRRQNWTFVHPLAEQLKKQIDGTVFVDYLDIDESRFEQSILRHLEECDVVLIVVTELTFANDRINQENDWIRREIALALQKKKDIVLIRVDNQLLPQVNDLPLSIRTILDMQAISIYQSYYTEGVQRLVSFLNKITGSREDSSPILRRVQDALVQGDYLSAKRTLEKIVDTLEDDGLLKQAAKAKYMLALALLAGKRPFVQTLTTMRSVEIFLKSALTLHPSHSYLLILALFKLDFARNGLSHYANEADELLYQAKQVARTQEDSENLKLLLLCQPHLTNDYLS